MTPARTRIVEKRFPTAKDPLKILVGKKSHRHVPIEELEEKLETRYSEESLASIRKKIKQLRITRKDAAAEVREVRSNRAKRPG